MHIATIQPARHIDHEPVIGVYRRVHRNTTGPVESAPNYLLRRVSAIATAVVAVVTIAAGANGLLASFGGGTAAAAEASPALSSVEPATHVARSGDTMWSIASEHRGTVDHDRYVSALIRLNGDASIQAGQAVTLP